MSKMFFFGQHAILFAKYVNKLHRTPGMLGLWIEGVFDTFPYDGLILPNG